MTNVTRVVFLIAALLLAAYTIDVLLIAFAGILLGILLRTAAGWIHDRSGIPSGWSLFIVVAAIASIVVANLWLFGVNVAAQIDQLSAAAHQARDSIVHYLEKYEWSRRIVSQGADGGQVMTGAKTALSGVIHFFAALLLIVLVAIYTAADPGLYRRGFIRILPKHWQQEATTTMSAVGNALRWWLLGQFVSMSVVGVLTTVGLWGLGVPLPITLGFLAALLTFIPNVGAIVSTTLATTLAMTKDVHSGLSVLLLYAVILSFEAWILTPLIQQRAVSLPPALTIIVQAFMGVAVGPLGVALGAPLTVVGLVLTKRLHVSEKIPTAGEQVRRAGPLRRLRP